jgi:hypothetical protein
LTGKFFGKVAGRARSIHHSLCPGASVARLLRRFRGNRLALARAAHRLEPIDHTMRQRDQVNRPYRPGESQPCDCLGSVDSIAAKAT